MNALFYSVSKNNEWFQPNIMTDCYAYMKISPANRLYLGLTAVIVLVVMGGFLSWWTSGRGGGVTNAILLLNTAIILIIGLVLMFFIYKEFYYGQHVRKKLNTKLEEVVRLNRIANDRNWLLGGLNDMKESLLGIHKPESLAYKCLLSLTTQVGLTAAALYFYEEEKLRLCSNVNLPGDAPASFVVGEGLLGHAAAQKEIQVITDLPSDYWHLASATGNLPPRTLVFVPLYMGDELVGVIELVAFKKVTPLQLQLLELLSKDIAVALHAASEREKAMLLLQQVQEQKEALYCQQEELRQSNEELHRQSEILQASEEELRVQEEELRQVNAEMTMKNAELETARQALSLKAAELEANSRYKSEFLANMSHELRTPLNSILILAKMLEENKECNLFPRQVEYATIMHKSGSDLLRLINDILDLSKIEAGKVELAMEPVRIADIIDDLDSLFGVVAQEKQIEYTTEVAAGIPGIIFTDKLRLEQVIRNLLANAFKFTPNGGSIRVLWYRRPENALCISVADTGPGIPAEKQQLIFEAFHQGDGATTRQYGGTGLGLSISRELMVLLKGEIHLDNSSPRGSIFTVLLPLTTGSLHLRKEPATEGPTTVQPVFHDATIQFPVRQKDDRHHLYKGDQLILIVEEKIFFADLVRDIARRKGFKTIVAYNVQDGLFYARKYLPVAIILDIDLPATEGCDILEGLRSNEEVRRIPIHMISAAEVPAVVIDNVNGYTKKPTVSDDLERMFVTISTQMQARLKQVLLISHGPLTRDPQLTAKSVERQLEAQYDAATGISEALSLLSHKKYDGIIFDIGPELSRELARLEELSKMNTSGYTPVIVYIDRDITPAEEQQLKRHAAAIVRKSACSADRLMDELELLLYRMEHPVLAPVAPLHPAINILEGKQVLLVDDDMRNIFSIGALLEEQGLKVFTASDGKEALSVLDGHQQIDLVLMDIMMPEMDGIEAMKHIRGDKRFMQLPVIAVTAKAMPGDRQQCLEAGASDYIAKPVDSSKLLSLLHVWLS
ncbi:histidine kinase [Chitinophaga flava]|uniref:histidine kinase n=2 Tax=Chitinophaga flava TaxID=2259036 RepID=A0A365XZZ1_9BACT|nr:histidine kinase [Chitinophaga flava]